MSNDQEHGEVIRIDRRPWEEFADTKLLWWINRTLHLFGWAIVIVEQDGKIIDAYPARHTFNGFSDKVNDQGYKALRRNFGILRDDPRKKNAEKT